MCTVAEGLTDSGAKPMTRKMMRDWILRGRGGAEGFQGRWTEVHSG